MTAIAGAGWLTTAAHAAPGDAPAPGCIDGIQLAVDIAPPEAVQVGEKQTFRYTGCDNVATADKNITTQVVKLKDARRPADHPGNATPMTGEMMTPYPAHVGTWEVPANAAAGAYAVVVKFVVGRNAGTPQVHSEATINFHVKDAAAPPPAPPSPPPAPAPAPVPTPEPLAAPAPQATPRAAPAVAPKLQIRKTANRKVVSEGGRVQFKLNLRNTGKGHAREVVMCDVMPRGLSAVRAPGASIQNGQICWKRAGLAPGQSWTRTLVARADGNLGRARLLRNVAVAHAANAPRKVRDTATVMAIGKTTVRAPKVTG